jgi:hypothetical protein
MKTKLLTSVCIVAISFLTVRPAMASADEPTTLNTVADIVIVRPACFAATIVGSCIFVVALPIAAISRSINKTADTLVVRPAKATFCRPVGEMDSLEE